MENTAENNRLIADFMGYLKGLNVTPTHFRYNSSWEMLIPVVEKIEDLEFSVRIEGASVEILDENEEVIIFNLNCSGTKIDSVYDAVVQFVKWYTS